MDKDLDAKHKIESTLSQIGAKVADANDIAQQMQKLSQKQKQDLTQAQEEISELYESLDELGEGAEPAAMDK